MLMLIKVPRINQMDKYGYLYLTVKEDYWFWKQNDFVLAQDFDLLSDISMVTNTLL